MNDYGKRLGKKGLKLLLSPKGLLAMCILAIGILLISFLFSVVALISDSDDCSNVAQPDANLPVSTDTKGYAKMIFNHMVQVEGSSGAGAAGVLAIVERESQFNLKLLILLEVSQVGFNGQVGFIQQMEVELPKRDPLRMET